MNGIKRCLSLSLLTSLLVLGGTAAPAFALERFASPTGLTTGDCEPVVDACTLERATELVAVNGETVTVLPGNHTSSSLIAPPNAIVVRGEPGQPMPVLTSTNTSGAFLLNNAGATVRRLEIVANPPSGVGGALGANGGTIEQVIARVNSTSNSATACNLSGGPTIRDSVCVNNGPSTGSALDIDASAAPTTTTVRNVTAFSVFGEGMTAVTGPAESITVNATNVIARGAGGGNEEDVEAQLGAGTLNTVNLDHSNYDTVFEFGGATITDPGTGTNQTAAPAYVNVAGGDFHQTAASPTRNAGIGGAGLGSLDIDGEARSLGAAPDIGADEFTEAPLPPDADGDGVPDASDTCPSQAGPASNNGCPVPADTGGGGGGGSGDGGGSGGGDGGGGGGATPDTDDPETEITKSPKKGLKAGDTAKVSFESDEDGSTFECKVGKKGKFKACTSPLRIRNLEKGKTKVQIRAVDSAGNVDETPAKLTIEAGNGKDNR